MPTNVLLRIVVFGGLVLSRTHKGSKVQTKLQFILVKTSHLLSQEETVWSSDQLQFALLLCVI